MNKEFDIETLLEQGNETMTESGYRVTELMYYPETEDMKCITGIVHYTEGPRLKMWHKNGKYFVATDHALDLIMPRRVIRQTFRCEGEQDYSCPFDGLGPAIEKLKLHPCIYSAIVRTTIYSDGGIEIEVIRPEDLGDGER
jgi:hypothetical protein